MIRGIEKTVQAHEVEVGKFYLAPSASNGRPLLFQAVQAGARHQGALKMMALTFSYEGEQEIRLDELDWYDTLVAMPPVHVRVDPPSAIGTGTSSRVKLRTLMVRGDEALIAVQDRFLGHTLMSISSGRVAERNQTFTWVAFSRWSLVVDEAGEEIVIASFGQVTE
jgi:hypothetical protein